MYLAANARYDKKESVKERNDCRGKEMKREKSYPSLNLA